jgi:hypothetical protein
MLNMREQKVFHPPFNTGTILLLMGVVVGVGGGSMWYGVYHQQVGLFAMAGNSPGATGTDDLHREWKGRARFSLYFLNCFYYLFTVQARILEISLLFPTPDARDYSRSSSKTTAGSLNQLIPYITIGRFSTTRETWLKTNFFSRTRPCLKPTFFTRNPSTHPNAWPNL